MTVKADIYRDAQGRWPAILRAIGIDEHVLRDEHGPCPICGGKDRFRFDDKEGKGTFFCSKCGAGNGMTLTMLYLNLDFKAAIRRVREIIPSAPQGPVAKSVDPEEIRRAARRVWEEAAPIVVGDEAHRYLLSRGLNPSVKDLPKCLRLHPELEYRNQATKHVEGAFPALLAAVQDKGGKFKAVHRTWLQNGRKAPVSQPKKTLGKYDAGCAIRLAEVEKVMGVTEGVENAFSVMEIAGVPTWALISAGQLEKFDWPQGLEELVIFGDRDSSFTGQKASYTLAYRAKSKGIRVSVELPVHDDTDWNDVLRNGKQGIRT